MPIVLPGHQQKCSVTTALKNIIDQDTVHSYTDSHQCTGCSKSAYQHMASIRRIYRQGLAYQAIDLLAIVEAMEGLLSDHLSMSAPWLDSAYDGLQNVVNWLQDQNISGQASNEISAERKASVTMYDCAIRITVHYAHAQRVELADPEKALIQYHLCLSIPSCPLDYQQTLQQKASMALSRLRGNSGPSSRTSSSRSSLSSSSSSCASCGIEKPRMPVCARCRIQAYCSMQCLRVCKHYEECGK